MREDGEDREPRGGGEGSGERRESGEGRRERDPLREGVRQGLGFLSAIRDALEETIEEARQRGDLSQDRAQEAVRRAVARAQEAAAGARDRFDVAGRGDLEALERKVEDLERRLRIIEGGKGTGSEGDRPPGANPGEPNG